MSPSIVDVLQACPLGEGRTEAELTALAASLPTVALAPGEALVEAGDAADAAWILLEGELEIRAPDGTWLDREGPGALVGEQALLPDGGGARNATVRATAPARLLRIDADRFSALMAEGAGGRAQVEAAADDKTRNRLGRLSEPFRHLLAASARTTWEEGAVLFREGDAADGLHLILAGQARVVVERDGGSVHLSTVYPGRVFGEIATLRGVPRTAGVVAGPGLRTAFVRAEDALALQQAHPDLEAFLRSLLRSYELPRSGSLHQRSVFSDGQACVETVYALGDGRQLTALQVPGGGYTLQTTGAEVAKTLEVADGTAVLLDAAHRVVGLRDAGRYDDIGGLHALALDGAPLSPQQRRGLRKAAQAAAQRKPDAVVCRCLNLERAQLVEAVGRGAGTPEALRDATGCGTVCGGCLRAAVPALLRDVSAGGAAAPGGAAADGADTALAAPVPAASEASGSAWSRLVAWLRGLFGG